MDSAGTQTVALTGIGVASPIALNPTSIAFGSQTVGVKTTVPVTVTNNSAATITFTSIAITPAGTVSYTQTNNCGSSIAAAGTCTIQVSFDPHSTGAKDDFVTLTDSAGTQTVTLTGTGVASGSIGLNPTSIAFGSLTVGVKTTVPVTVTNNSASAVTISSIAITPTGTVSYTETNNCGTSIAAAGTCTIQVSFDPQSAGTVSYTHLGPIAARMLSDPGAGRRFLNTSSRTSKTDVDEMLPTLRRHSHEAARSVSVMPKASAVDSKTFGPPVCMIQL